jgi:hypothetical protein
MLLRISGVQSLRIWFIQIFRFPVLCFIFSRHLETSGDAFSVLVNTSWQKL